MALSGSRSAGRVGLASLVLVLAFATSAGAQQLADLVVTTLDGVAVGTYGNATLTDRRTSFDEVSRLYRQDVDVLV